MNNSRIHWTLRVAVMALLSVVCLAQTGPATTKTETAAKTGVLPSADAKKLVPHSFFYAGQTAPVQMRNSGVFRWPSGKLIVAALVDTSGYSTAIAEKYQGFLITEAKVRIGDKELPAGAYGVGALPDGRFIVTDLGAAEIFSVPFATDEALRRPVPLKLVSQGQSVRLYLGKRYVGIDAL